MESPRSSPWAQISGSWAGSRGFLPLCIFPLTAHNSLPHSGTRTFVFKTLSNKNPINEIRSPLLSNMDQLKPSWLCILILINSSPLGSQNVGVINRVVVNQMNFQNNCWSTISVYCKCYDKTVGQSRWFISHKFSKPTKQDPKREFKNFTHFPTHKTQSALQLVYQSFHTCSSSVPLPVSNSLVFLITYKACVRTEQKQQA